MGSLWLVSTSWLVREITRGGQTQGIDETWTVKEEREACHCGGTICGKERGTEVEVQMAEDVLKEQ